MLHHSLQSLQLARWMLPFALGLVVGAIAGAVLLCGAVVSAVHSAL